MDLLTDYLTVEYLKKLESFKIHFHNRLKTGFFGSRKAHGHGNSLEFSDFRQYDRGDDARRIDWNSYARSDKLFVKLFAEEKQAAAHLFIDTSLSMDFGEGLQNKLIFAKLLAASIAYVCLTSGDSVFVYSFGETIGEPVAAHTKNGFRQIVDALEQMKPDGKTMYSQSFSPSVTGAKKMRDGISVVISDFFSQDGYESLGNTLVSKRQMPVFVQILSPEEVNPRTNGRFNLIDSETNEQVEVEINQRAFLAYDKALYDYRKNIERYCMAHRAYYYFAETGQNVLSMLQGLC